MGMVMEPEPTGWPRSCRIPCPQRAGHDRDLGGAAGGGAGHGVGQIYEEVCYARPLQEGSEDDKHDYELGADVHRRGEHALGGVEQAVDYRVKALAAGKGVNQQRARHAEYGQAHAAAAELRQHSRPIIPMMLYVMVMRMGLVSSTLSVS